MISRLSVQTDRGTFSVAYSCPVPKWFGPLLEEMVWAYSVTMSRRNDVRLDLFSRPVADLVRRYYEVNRIPAVFSGQPFQAERGTKRTPPRTDRGSLLFSGGIDSTYMLLEALRLVGDKSRVQCIYVTDINKSMSNAESWAVRAICEKLGVRCRIVEVVNALELRYLHRGKANVGLREQLLFVAALPYILDFRSTTVGFGIHGEFYGLVPSLFTDHLSAFKLFAHRLEESGVSLSVLNHFDLDVQYVDMIRILWKKRPDIFALTAACLFAPDFRERLRAIQLATFPNLPFPHGCCMCGKCLCSSAVLYLHDPRARRAPRQERAAFERYVLKKAKTDFAHYRPMQHVQEIFEARAARRRLS